VSTLGHSFRNRLLPAVLTAAGVTLIAAGLLSYSGASAAAEPDPSAAPTVVSMNPGATLVLPTLPPPDSSASIVPDPSPTANPNRVATRVVMEALGIDLPIVKPRGNESTYPLCNVAMYIQELHQPGSGKATYIYAHARDGMFGPIYERAIQKKSGGPKSMIGMLVQVYTNDDLLFEYEITEVRLHQLNLNAAVNASSEQLWLQTSEGPHGTPGKTQLVAQPLIVFQADHATANPKPHPVVCG
jgi:hypothetical protein